MAKERIGLIDADSKIVNLALMKYSAYYKALGHTVVFNPLNADQVDKVFCSVVFAKNKEKAFRMKKIFPNIEFGGTGIDLTTTLPAEVEAMRPDYDLYNAEFIYKRIGGIMTKEKKMEKAVEIVNAGIGFLSRGCVRSCGFCVVPEKEGGLKRVANVEDLINPRSRNVILLDNNLTANPDCVEILCEVKERDLTIDISQGIDVRTMTPEIARALASVKHMRKIHYAWDHPGHETSVLRGIETLAQHVRKYRHMCFTLVGFESTFEEDQYRYRKLMEIGVDPYIMVFNQSLDARLRHFARWVNGRFCKACAFDDFDPWVKDRDAYFGGKYSEQMSLFDQALVAA